MNRYNGWANRPTWLCFTWIMDFEYNYTLLRSFTPGKISQITVRELIKHFYFGDKIAWDELDLPELRSAFLDHIRDLHDPGEITKALSNIEL